MENLNSRPPATEESIGAFESTSGKQLTPDYREFLTLANGGEGFIGKHSYVIFWSLDELASMNRAYEVDNYAPGLLMFASDGGGEAFGFDTRSTPWTVVQVPFIGLGWKLARPMAKSFLEFLEHLHKV
jgi:hypothetical protein